jgi:hypothetical protein
MPFDADAIAKGSQFTTMLTDSRPDAKAVQTIVNAIKALDLTQGIVFKPFRIAVLPRTFTNIWNSERGDTPITFFQSNGSGGQFLPLGDMAIAGQTLGPDGVPNMPGVLFAPTPDDPTALAHPLGFTKLLDDNGDGNPRWIDYFSMNPPKGYVAMGLAFSGGDLPNVNNYWCVRSDLVRPVNPRLFWNDQGSHWVNADGNLSEAIANLPINEPNMVYAPPTLIGVGMQAYVLVMEQAELAITQFGPTQPPYDPTLTAGDKTSYGLESVKILPYNAVPDPGFPNQSTTSPFYFVAAEPFYRCTQVLPTPGGGNIEITKTVGTSQSDSNTFTQQTSMTVSADAGIEFGPLSPHVSASYTNSFSTSVSHTSEHSTQVQTQITLNLPARERTWFWQRQTQIAVFRHNHTQLAAVTYSQDDIQWVSSPS